MKKQAYFKFNTSEGICEITLTLRPSEREGFEYYFLPNKSLSPDLKKQFYQLKLNHERQHFYNGLGHWETRLQEGCIFGLKYAYNQYLTSQRICVEVSELKYNHGTTHDLAVYVTVMAFIKLLDISTLKLPYFSKERNRFIFPNADRFPIGIRTMNDMIKIHSDKILKELGQELYDKMKEIENDYFSR